MHISTGKFEGCEIKDSKSRGSLSTRELTVKEEMFAIAGSKVHEAEVLDINDFNGICGLEALSRGAKEVHFVGEDIDSYRIIEHNLKTLKADDATLSKESVKEYLADLNPEKKFRIIFFEVQSQSDNGLEEKLIEHLAEDGFMFMMVPVFGGGFKVPTKIEGGYIQETRDCEQRVVLVVTKACETNSL